MFLRTVKIEDFKVLKNININFENNENNMIFPIIAINGGGKSTLLQFIFSFIHCPFVASRQQYLKNLLEGYELKSDININKLASFELEENGDLIKISFSYCENNYENFNSILELKRLIDLKEKNNKLYEDINILNRLVNEININNIPHSFLRRELMKFTNSRKEVELLEGSDMFLSFIEKTKEKIQDLIVDENEIGLLLIKNEIERNKLMDILNKKNLKYAFHFNDKKNVLLYETNVSDEILNEISDKIYLAAPSSQIFHFFDTKELDKLFTRSLYHSMIYENTIMNCQQYLPNFFTYDFSTINLIIEALEKAKEDDFTVLLETEQYGSKVTATLKELGSLLLGKKIKVNNTLKKITIIDSNSGLTLSSKDLSHGELKKLSIYIWIKSISNNSLILMDEVDMGLHPTWQHELCNDLKNWSFSSQYLIATHSPQIISKSYYKNIVILDRTDKGIQVEQLKEAPLEGDLNTIVKTVMGGEYIPKELAELRNKYYELFLSGKINTEEAIQLKSQILMYESENSSFFQNINFQIKLRK